METKWIFLWSRNWVIKRQLDELCRFDEDEIKVSSIKTKFEWLLSFPQFISNTLLCSGPVIMLLLLAVFITFVDVLVTEKWIFGNALDFNFIISFMRMKCKYSVEQTEILTFILSKNGLILFTPLNYFNQINHRNEPTLSTIAVFFFCNIFKFNCAGLN